MNEAVGMKNWLDMSGGKKHMVRTFRRQEFWKCIGCIILEVTYGKKGYTLWIETPIYFGRKPQTNYTDILVVPQI